MYSPADKPGVAPRQRWIGHQVKYAHTMSSAVIRPGPISNGKITYRTEAAHIIDFTLRSTDTLGINTSITTFVVAEPLFTTEYARKYLIEYFFETFSPSKIAFVPQPVLALYGLRKRPKTGIVIDSGYDSTRIVPVHKGQVLRDAMCILPIGERQILKYLDKIKGPGHTCAYGYRDDKTQYLRELKNQLCYIALDFDEEMEKSKESTTAEGWFKGERIETVKSRFRAPEVLFRPQNICEKSLYGHWDPVPKISADQGGIHELVYESLLKCDANIRYELMKNILICGGNAKIKGMAERLNKELQKVLFARNLVGIVLSVMCREEGVAHRLAEDIMNLIDAFYADSKYQKLVDKVVDISVVVGDEGSAWRGGSPFVTDDAFESYCIKREAAPSVAPE